MHNKRLFPTLISKIENFLSIEQCEDIETFIRQTDGYNHGSLSDGISSHKDGNLFELMTFMVPSCSDIVGRLDDILNEVSNTHKIPSLKISNSWFNIQKKGSKLKEHVHPESIISAAIYINVDENSSPLKFFNPNPFVRFTPTTDFDEHNYWWWEEKPKKGMIILFPSWLMHGSEENLKDTTERVVVSFNTERG